MTEYPMKEAARQILERLPRGLPAFQEGDRVQLSKGGPFEVVTRVHGFESRLRFQPGDLSEVGVWVATITPEGKKRGRKVPFLVPGNEPKKEAPA